MNKGGLTLYTTEILYITVLFNARVDFDWTDISHRQKKGTAPSARQQRISILYVTSTSFSEVYCSFKVIQLYFLGQSGQTLFSAVYNYFLSPELSATTDFLSINVTTRISFSSEGSQVLFH